MTLLYARGKRTGDEQYGKEQSNSRTSFPTIKARGSNEYHLKQLYGQLHKVLEQ